MNLTEDAERFTEEMLNIVLDEVDDIIMIHDSEHTIVWMNRAGTKVFSRGLEDVIGDRCYHLFGRDCCCDDCRVSTLVGGNKAHSFRTIPGTGEKYICISTPIMKGGDVKLVVQHLKKADTVQ
jgi:PAS domain-containing protein